MYQRTGRIAPQACENAFMPERRKSDAGVAERRRDDEAGQAEADREVAHQKLQQRAQCQIADDQQRSRDDHHRHIALERDPEQSLQNQRHRQHDDEEDREQRRKLARQRDDRVAARAGEPGAHAAPAELGANRVAGGDRDDHMQHHRQQRAQQELGVVPLRVDQHDGLGDERADAGRFRRRAGSAAALGGGREAVAQPRRGDARGGEELLVIEGRRPAGGARPSGRARNWPACRRRRWPRRSGSRARPRRGRRRARRCSRLGDAATCSTKAREVSDRSASTTTTPSPRITGWLNTARQHREGEQRHAEDQDERRAVVQQPAPFAPGDQQEPGLRPAGFIRASASPDRHSCRDAAPAPCRPGRRGSRRCAGRNRRWRGWRASSHIRPWWRSA